MCTMPQQNEKESSDVHYQYSCVVPLGGSFRAAIPTGVAEILVPCGVHRSLASRANT
jgi:hypothetical protein